MPLYCDVQLIASHKQWRSHVSKIGGVRLSFQSLIPKSTSRLPVSVGYVPPPM